jgi:hypothetical protein
MNRVLGRWLLNKGRDLLLSLLKVTFPPHGEIRLVCRQEKGIGIILAGILLLGIRTLSHSLRPGENRTPTLRKTKKITKKPTVPIGLSILTISLFPIRIFLLPFT